MPHGRQEVLALVAELRSLCTRPTGPGIFERVEQIAKSIQQNAGVPVLAAQALDVRFKAEDVYSRPHLMAESVLRQMLNERLHRLEATARAALADVPLIPVERRSDARSGRRASDRPRAI